VTVKLEKHIIKEKFYLFELGGVTPQSLKREQRSDSKTRKTYNQRKILSF